MRTTVQKVMQIAAVLTTVLVLLVTAVLPIGASSSNTGTGVVGGSLTSEDIAHVEIQPIEIIENTYGDWQLHIDEETGEEVDYYCYDWSAFISYTITLTNGDVIKAPDGYFSYNGVQYPLVYFHSHQTYENRWLVGNTYTVEHTILGEVYEIPVTIVESPVSSIRCDREEIVIREGTYCDLLPDSASELYQYRWYEAANWVVTYTDGREETTYDRIVEIDGHNYSFNFTDAQATLQNWTAGNTYTGHAEFLGAECDVDVRITDSFIKDIQFEPIYVYEGADGHINTQYDPELGKDREYFRYNWTRFIAYTATLFDGTVIEGTGDYLYYDGEYYGFQTSDTQSLFMPWLSGQVYPVNIAVLGETYTAAVRVKPNPVADIQFANIVIPQGLYGETVEEYDPLSNQVFTVFQYDAAEFFDYIVSFNDGTTAEAGKNGFWYDGRSYGASIIGGSQTHDNVWEAGKTYHITVSVMGVERVIPVHITAIPEAEGFGYIRNYDGTVTITECSKTDERLTIPSTIGEYTVTGIQSLDMAEDRITEILIPKSIEQMSWCDFTSFDKLTTIYYEGSEDDWRDISHCYTGYDGLSIVYNHAAGTPPNESVEGLVYAINDGEVMIIGCDTDAVGELVIPETIGGYPVTGIREWAFSCCDGLTLVKIPDSVTSIHSGAFNNCKNLISIHIPDRVMSIGSGAFFGCNQLKDVWYTGTPVQKKDMIVEEQNTYLLDAAWYYNTCKKNTHIYDGDCDADCNACEWVRMATNDHTYTDLYDATCNVCGNIREVPTRNGWVLEGSQWKYYKNNVMQKNSWLQLNGIWYYLKDNGTMATGWCKLGYSWYYFNEYGVMKTGWLQLGSTWYYLQPSGAMATGWTTVGSAKYYFNAGGAMQTGWLQQNGVWYYLKPGGDMAKSWCYIGNQYYYFNAEGKMQTGWVQVGGTWYYLHAGGNMATGWLKLGNTYYYLQPSGSMTTGWVKVGSAWYYMNAGGAMQTGWLRLGNNWYYLHASGAMATGTVKIGNATYRFNSSGVWIA